MIIIMIIIVIITVKTTIIPCVLGLSTHIWHTRIAYYGGFFTQ